MGAGVDTEVVLALRVDGLPVQQGSMTSFPVTRIQNGKRVPVMNRKTGFPLVDMKASNEKELKAWRKLVTAEARAAWAGREWIDRGVPVFVSIEFRFPRRAGDLRADGSPRPDAPFYKTSTPDVDKLQRAAFDALTDAEVWRDDALVCDVHARKVYADTPSMAMWVSIPTNDSKEAAT